VNELETVLAARITRLEKALIRLIALLIGNQMLTSERADRLADILRGLENKD